MDILLKMPGLKTALLRANILNHILWMQHIVE
jgi:hypothetical protein